MLRRLVALPVLASLALSGLVALGASPAAAVNSAHSTLVSGDPADFTPHVNDGSVRTIVQVGNRIIAGGNFTSVRNADDPTTVSISRSRLFAFDATTGQIDSAFAPAFNGTVTALETDGTSVFVGGEFTQINGTAASRLVKLDGTTGARITTFKAKANSAVEDLVLRSGRLYVAGRFTRLGTGSTPPSRLRLGAVDPTSGMLDSSVDVPVEGTHNGGTTRVSAIDVSADGSRLVAIGNFASVGGAPRLQAAIVNVAARPAAVSAWSTSGYGHDPDGTTKCFGVFDTYLRGLDISPDGRYFVIATTGGGNAALCDTAARWELTDTPDATPTWVNYSGGDTLWAVGITGPVVYLGGHQRWLNNPFGVDNAGPGAIGREGIAALDPKNGLPLTWNPGRARGVAVFALYATSQGLWVGSDTTRIGKETHGRIALMPLAGGAALPTTPAAKLPKDLYLPEATAGGTTSGALHRINVGGSELPAIDSGPAWSADTSTAPDSRHNTGSNTASWAPVGAVDSTVPASTPRSVFDSERWDPSAEPEMAWNMAVPTDGRQLKVRVHLANRCDCTASPGQRVFDIVLEGRVVDDNLDIAAVAGHNVGTTREFTIPADGNVDLDFVHQVENPLVNGIEVIDVAAAGIPVAGDRLFKRSFDGTTAGTRAAVSTGTNTVAWSQVRGAFFRNGGVVYGYSDGRIYSRTLSKNNALGPQRAIDMRDDPDTGARIPWSVDRMTGMFFDPDTHRIYYTVAGDSRLFYRYFAPQSLLVGAAEFAADGGGVDFSRTAGLTLASGNVYFGSSADGALRRAPFGGGRVTGAASVVNADGTWTYRGIFLRNN